MKSVESSQLNSSKSTSLLLQLPRELRDLIFEFTVALDTDDPFAYDVLIGFWGKYSTTRPGTQYDSMSPRVVDQI